MAKSPIKAAGLIKGVATAGNYWNSQGYDKSDKISRNKQKI
jgi:hypothetical protein